ncbi:TauD/TfdA dioxygenase family protein [Streptomyces sp. BE303]|uniref:TauD/TfdA dioxygenase family protein n=1 Tax=Streptomyces sp. BE303 TaxID=3002528 RepID=UPI002E794A55|nr:TauD/TfdA family dioxygenase [Streptomyces sp. BE303]MED7948863.1 TauD/TfdA family dioxygenase [Streptomyces sp. BE303]
MDVRPLTPVLGAEIHGATVPELIGRDGREVLRTLLLTHGVLVLRGQDTLDRARHEALGRQFGALEIFPGHDPDRPCIARIEHGADAPPTENIWHSDMSFRPEPPMGAVLRAVTVPASGGDTLFADMREVWRRLPPDLRDVLRPVRAEHSIAKFAPAALRDALLAAAPPLAHPVLRVHPETGEEILYVNQAYTTRALGLSPARSAELLDFLLRGVTVPEVQCRIRWQPGTVVLWDNRSLQHYAVGDYLPARRVMERVSIAGDAPLGASGTPLPAGSLQPV